MIVVTIPAFALLLAALHGRSRKPLAAHLVFATHFYAYHLLVSIVVTALGFAVV